MGANMADNEQYLSYDLTKSTTRVVFVCEEVFIAGHHHNILNNRHAATPSSSIALVSVDDTKIRGLLIQVAISMSRDLKN